MNLRGGLSGYTIVEIMLTLAISSLIFLTAMRLFGSQAADTQFSQSMQDLSSYITNTVKTISTNVSDAYSKYSCSPTPGDGGVMRATLTSPAGTNNDCVYLGKAFLAPPVSDSLPGSNTLYVYSVFGARQAYNGAVATGTATSLEDSNPTTGINTSVAPPIRLVQTYTLNSGTIKSSKPKDLNGNALGDNLVGYYTDLSGSSSGGDSNPHLQSKGYGITLANPNNFDDVVTGCIQKRLSEGNSCIANGDVATWSLCINSGSETARLDINNSAAGITSSLKFKANC